MDWSKAKNILIVAFIITNLFLLFNVEREILKQEDLIIVSSSYIEEVRNHLNENGIRIDTEIPIDIFSMPVLFVEYKNFDIEEISYKLLGEYNLTDENDENIYISDKGMVKVDGGKRLTYKSFEDTQIYYSMNEKKAIDISEDFLGSHNFNQKEIRLSQVYYGKVVEFDENPVYKLVYEQIYQSHFIGESYINVYVNKYGVCGIEVMLLEYDKTYPQKRKIIPATEALLRKMNKMISDNPNEEIVVNKIDVGYYFDPESVNVTNWLDIESGTAFPTWRIVLNNGKTYYVEGFKN